MKRAFAGAVIAFGVIGGGLITLTGMTATVNHPWKDQLPWILVVAFLAACVGFCLGWFADQSAKKREALYQGLHDLNNKTYGKRRS